MLAQNFKTPTDLGITDQEFDALVKTLGMFERGEVDEGKFNMEMIYHDCGTPACIVGWANFVSGRRAFKMDNHGVWGFAPNWDVMPAALKRLFAYGEHAERGVYSAEAPQAAIAIRNYLTTGEPRWEEALA